MAIQQPRVPRSSSDASPVRSLLALAGDARPDRRHWGPLALSLGAGLLWGLLAAADPASAGTLERLALLAAGAALAGLALHLTKRPARVAPTPAPSTRLDPLTGADDADQLQRDLERPQPSGPRGLVAVMDIDGFQPLCAELGASAGQRVLLGLAELLDQRLRRIDGLYRIGEDIFALRLPGLKLEEAAPRLYALHAELNAALSRLPGRATLSIGAALALPDEDGAAWLARAQAALVEARVEGPCRVHLDGGARSPRVEGTRMRALHPQFLPPPG